MSTSNLPDRFITVDENGWIIFENQQIVDEALAAEFYRQLFYHPNRSFGSVLVGNSVIVEAFDAPMIVQSFRVNKAEEKVALIFNYHFNLIFDFKTFTTSILPGFYLDPWDRVCGEGSNEIPFVFSKKAHEEFLDKLDKFDDDSVVFQGVRSSVSADSRASIESS